jgi:hypothetical protein
MEANFKTQRPQMWRQIYAGLRKGKGVPADYETASCVDSDDDVDDANIKIVSNYGLFQTKKDRPDIKGCFNDDDLEID